MRTPCMPAAVVASALWLAAGAPASAQNRADRPSDLLRQSTEFLQANQPERALALLQQAVALDPANAEARALLGQALLDTGHPDQALTHLQQAVRLRPGDSPTLFNLGVAELESGRGQKAFDTFSQLAARDPNELATKSYLVRAALRLKKNDTARTNLTALRQLAAGDALLHAQLVEWCFQEEAGPVTREQIQFTVDRKLPPAREARVRYLSGILYGRARRPREAAAEFAQAVALDETQEEYFSALVKQQAAEGNDAVDRALLKRGLEKFPDSRGLISTQALLMLEAGRIDDALRGARFLVEKYPKAPDGFVLSGRVQLSDLAFDRAQADLQRALALDPRDPEAWYYLGICQRRLDRDDAAAASFEKATSLNPSHSDAWLEYGRLLYDTGAYQKAGPALATTIKLRPNLAIAYNLMAQTQRKLGRSEEAARYLAQFKKLSAQGAAQP
ncbi:MAG: tetratricopeptide repeat protein [Candidatus Solibacter usitatus]|nr:tetratricopeptide repeat protein [Candidatus Solibacter usitatus]